jgi:hypothetical protein
MSSSSPQIKQNANADALQTLMGLENEALDASDLITLRHIAVNRPRALIQTGHIFWIARSGHKIKIEAMSSQAKVDKTTPFIQWIMRQLSVQARKGELDNQNQWQLDNSGKETPFTYPFSHALYAPLGPHPQSGGLLFTREHPFKKIDDHLVRRLARIFGLAATTARRKRHKRLNINRRLGSWGLAVIFALLLAIPVPMTTLAPAEIVAGKPFMMTAPFDGIVEDILVPPNSYIHKNMPVLRFVDITYQNEFILAGKEAAIAEAKLRQAAVSSFASEGAKGHVAIAEAEKALARARQIYAKERLAKTVLTAPEAGLAIYSDPTDWRGRHVTTGEAILQIADTADLRLRIEAPLSMGESLNGGARIKLFLDNAPLNALEAKLTSASYYAKAQPGGQMAYEAYAELDLGQAQSLPRIGARGVAKIYGRSAPLGYWIFRRPITVLRQSLGV